MKKEDREEVAQILHDRIEGGTEALKEILEPPAPPPQFSDAEVKQAILDISAEGFEQMLSRLEMQGVPREETINFLDEFSQGRRW